MTGIQSAAERAGGAAKLAAAIGVSHQVVYVWLRRGWVPNNRAVQIKDMYGIPRVSLINPQLAEFFGTAPTPATN